MSAPVADVVRRTWARPRGSASEVEFLPGPPAPTCDTGVRALLDMLTSLWAAEIVESVRGAYAAPVDGRTVEAPPCAA